MPLFLFLNDSVLQALSGQSKGPWGGWKQKEENGKENRSGRPAWGLTPGRPRLGRGARCPPMGAGKLTPTLACEHRGLGPGVPREAFPASAASAGGSRPQGPSGSLPQGRSCAVLKIPKLPSQSHLSASRVGPRHKTPGLRAGNPAALGKREGFPVLATTFPDTFPTKCPAVWFYQDTQADSLVLSCR